MRAQRHLGLVAAFALFSGCSGPPYPFDRTHYERRPGTLIHYSDPLQIQIPGSVTAGVPFIVRVTTYGGGCMKQGDTTTEVAGLSAAVRPYDYVAVKLPKNTGCPDILLFYPHQATLTFQQAGTAVVRVHGWRQPEGEAITVDRRITVNQARP